MRTERINFIIVTTALSILSITPFMWLLVRRPCSRMDDTASIKYRYYLIYYVIILLPSPSLLLDFFTVIEVFLLSQTINVNTSLQALAIIIISLKLLF